MDSSSEGDFRAGSVHTVSSLHTTNISSSHSQCSCDQPTPNQLSVMFDWLVYKVTNMTVFRVIWTKFHLRLTDDDLMKSKLLQLKDLQTINLRPWTCSLIPFPKTNLYPTFTHWSTPEQETTSHSDPNTLSSSRTQDH